MKHMNLIYATPVKAHRHLFRLENNIRIPKTNFTMQDLWEYYNLSFLGNGIGSALQFTTLEAIERNRQSLLSGIPPLQPDQEEILNSLIKQYGVEVILYAIDDYSGGSSDRVLEVKGLIYHIKEAEAVLARILRQESIG